MYNTVINTITTTTIKTKLKHVFMIMKGKHQFHEFKETERYDTLLF